MEQVVADRPGARSWGGRLVLVVSGIALIGSALWFGASWIDDPRPSSDQTCGSVFHRTLWLGSMAPAGCHNVMTFRAVVTGSMLVLAIAFIARAIHRQAISGRWIAAAVVALVGSGVVLVINEAVRPMGAL